MEEPKISELERSKVSCETAVTASSAAQSETSENLFDILRTQSEHLEDTCTGAGHPGPTFTQEGISPMLFSHLEQSSVSRYPCGCIPDQSSLELELDSVCQNCGCMKGAECETGDSDGTSCEEIVKSLQSLHVAESSRNLQQPLSVESRLSYGYSSQPLCRTCRQEVYAPSCLDDTTVDDLVGYFDQIMYIPKPMSEMAELMYT